MCRGSAHGGQVQGDAGHRTLVGVPDQVAEIPGAISQGETLEEARESLADALRMVLECNRELARETESVGAVREPHLLEQRLRRDIGTELHAERQQFAERQVAGKIDRRRFGAGRA